MTTQQQQDEGRTEKALAPLANQPQEPELSRDATWCRCPDPLPELVNPTSRGWTCSACQRKRRYHERLSIGAGGIVGRCGECRWDARKAGRAERTVPLTNLRAVTCTTMLAGQWRERNTYYLCDACCDAEIARQTTADITDGRRSVA